MYEGLLEETVVALSRPAIYERLADPVVELQLQKAGVRLGYLLNAALEAK
jgi:hypothetical protein